MLDDEEAEKLEELLAAYNITDFQFKVDLTELILEFLATEREDAYSMGETNGFNAGAEEYSDDSA